MPHPVYSSQTGIEPGRVASTTGVPTTALQARWPQGMALSGMGQGSGIIPRQGEAESLSLNEKWWGPFTLSAAFFL